MSKAIYTSTIRDVAEQAGVSISTVSRVVNRTGPVSQKVIALVEQAMRELNYVPRAAARSLVMGRTNTLGLVLPDIQGDFFTPLLRGIETVADEHGYVLLITTAGRRGPSSRLPAAIGPHNTDGLLIFDGGVKEDVLAGAFGLELPLVLVYQTPPDELPIPCVLVENTLASRALMEHLIHDHGRRRIVLLCGPQGNQDAYWREIGYREALQAHQIPLDPDLVQPGNFDSITARASIERLLHAGVAFDAVFAGGDTPAMGAYAALQQAGRRIPEDVAVVGFDDQRFAAMLNPPLSTVRAPTELVGVEAARKLLQLINTGHTEPVTCLPTELVLRRSCGC